MISLGRGEKSPVSWAQDIPLVRGDGLAIVRPTPWGRGKSSWGPWNGLVRGIIVSFRRGIKWVFFIDFGDRD